MAAAKKKTVNFGSRNKRLRDTIQGVSWTLKSRRIAPPSHFDVPLQERSFLWSNSLLQQPRSGAHQSECDNADNSEGPLDSETLYEGFDSDAHDGSADT